MADTIRTLSELLLLLANNTNGDISAQDLQDLTVSLAMQHGQLSVAGNAVATTIPDNTGFHEADVTGAVLSKQSSILGTDDFDMPVAGRLRYLGVQTRMFHIMCTISFTSASNNQEIHMQLANTGVVSDESELRRKVATGADVGTGAIHWLEELAQNEYVSLFAKNVTAANNITVVSFNLQAIGMIM